MIRLLSLIFSSAIAIAAPPMKYAFPPENGAYSAERGYGFDLGTKFDKPPYYLSVALPEGNYTVTVTLGDAQAAVTTIKAESRRLMLENVHTEAGKSVTRSFTVNVRSPKIGGGGNVKLKDREKAYLTWDDKLTLEINGERPALRSLEIAKADDAVTVFLVGDSTVTDQSGEPWGSWGQMLPRFFKAGAAVANYAESGETLKSSYGAKRLEKALSVMKKGDYLLIQFGHNDMKEKGDGIGAFTSYTASLKKYIAECRAKGGQPVLITSMHRNRLDDAGKIVNSLGDYPEAVRRVAKEEKLPLIDLHTMSGTLYEALGPKQVGKAFQDGSHHNNFGSYELARCVIEGIKANKLDIVKFLADDVKPFDPTKPDSPDEFKLPASPTVSKAKPEGS